MVPGYAGNVVANVLIIGESKVAIRLDYRSKKVSHRVSTIFESTDSEVTMDLPYSLIIEATEDPIIFGFFSRNSPDSQE